MRVQKTNTLFSGANELKKSFIAKIRINTERIYRKMSLSRIFLVQFFARFWIYLTLISPLLEEGGKDEGAGVQLLLPSPKH
jgi:hypothetical protein